MPPERTATAILPLTSILPEMSAASAAAPPGSTTSLSSRKAKATAAATSWSLTAAPAFEAAASALKAGYGADLIPLGCGGSIGFVRPLADLFGGAPALLLGIEDPLSNAHAPNESLPEEDWMSLMRSLAHLFGNLGALPGGKVK